VRRSGTSNRCNPSGTIELWPFHYCSVLCSSADFISVRVLWSSCLEWRVLQRLSFTLLFALQCIIGIADPRSWPPSCQRRSCRERDTFQVSYCTPTWYERQCSQVHTCPI
jgi:hypothetical protein